VAHHVLFKNRVLLFYIRCASIERIFLELGTRKVSPVYWWGYECPLFPPCGWHNPHLFRCLRIADGFWGSWRCISFRPRELGYHIENKHVRPILGKRLHNRRL